MPETLRSQSALQAYRRGDALARWQSARLCIGELPARGLLQMQLLDDSPSLQARINTITGLTLPPQGVLALADGRELAWLAPREWLWLLPPGEEQQMASLIDAACARAVVLTPVSDSRVAIEVSGADARLLLASSCSIDLHPDAFGPARVVGARLAQLAVVLKRSDARDAFQVLVDRAEAAWLWRWLLDAATEFAP